MGGDDNPLLQEMNQQQIHRKMRNRAFLRILVSSVVCYTCFGFVMWNWPAPVVSVNRSKEQSVHRNKDSAFTPVVIVAYMRSGSSLTGNLIQQDPDVFYVFEPLHGLVRGYQKEMLKQFPEFPLLAERPLMVVREEVEDLYRAWFTCDMDYIISETYRYHISFFKLGYKTQLLLKCLENASEIVYHANKMPCTDYLRKLCLESRHRVLKTIRTPLSWFHGLMGEFPNMKIIHLVRDPRAILTSQRRFGECARGKHGGLAGCTKFVCSSLEDDLTTFEMFSKLFPNRIFRLKYEDVALKPIAKTKELYHFLNLKYTDATEKYVENITMSGNNKSFVLDTVVPNSIDMIDKWRTKISDELLETVQTMCRYVMNQLSYYHFIKPL
ncbi:carbohydrate sulfotransferase 1-like [Mercenaria mercenaria]|uniref:carbohydrate sulfotransferase 1-like n=1 Tax=Mercenaria mercenaria TaxID=6596 RepID=UPI001E1D3FA5|nr:carbohydrate sulfotransferase 1-like [Mercenaria mercenaria]